MSIAYSKSDAETLVQMAGAANGDLSNGPGLPGGWVPLRTFKPSFTAPAQGFLASGLLLSLGKRVAVMATGMTWGNYITSTLPGSLDLTPIIPQLKMKIPPPSDPKAPNSQLAQGFQFQAAALGDSLRQHVDDLDGLDTLIFAGIGQGGPLATLLSISAQTVPSVAAPGGDSGEAQKSLPGDIACYAFSCPPVANKTMQTLAATVQPPIFQVRLQDTDFFPSAPGSAQGYFSMGSDENVPSKVPAFDPPWYERSAGFYQSVLAGTPADAEPTATGRSISGAGPEFDAGLALTLSILASDTYRARNHPQAPPNIPRGWTISASLADCAGAIRGMIYTNFEWAVVAFGGTVTMTDYATSLTDFRMAAPSFLPQTSQKFMVQEGPLEIYDDLRPSLQSGLKSIAGLDKLKVALTGHDMGGQLAALASMDLSQGIVGIPKPSAVYTYGAPPVADAGFARYAESLLSSPWQRLMRPADVYRNPLIWSATAQYPQNPISLNGTTTADGNTSHAVNTYISLLDNRGG